MNVTVVTGSTRRRNVGDLIRITAEIRAAWSRMTRPRLVGLLRFCAKKPVSCMTILLILMPTRRSARDDDTLYRHVILYLICGQLPAAATPLRRARSAAAARPFPDRCRGRSAPGAADGTGLCRCVPP